jgi:DNA-binding NarL/FixJ family response regulator
LNICTKKTPLNKSATLRETKAILIADDHEEMLQGLFGILSKAHGYEVVGMARHGEELVDQAIKLAPDLCLVDYEMPGINGLLASEMLLKENKNTKIIILTMHNEKSLLRRIKAAGIKGYLLKGCENNELLTAINAVLEGGTYFA